MRLGSWRIRSSWRSNSFIFSFLISYAGLWPVGGGGSVVGSFRRAEIERHSLRAFNGPGSGLSRASNKTGPYWAHYSPGYVSGGGSFSAFVVPGVKVLLRIFEGPSTKEGRSGLFWCSLLYISTGGEIVGPGSLVLGPFCFH